MTRVIANYVYIYISILDFDCISKVILQMYMFTYIHISYSGKFLEGLIFGNLVHI